MGKHTPGPWKVEYGPSTHRYEIQDPDKWAVAFIHVPVVTDQPTEANARLIAAAPDLYEACKALWTQALQSELNDPANEWGYEAIQKANAAISQAEAKL